MLVSELGYDYAASGRKADAQKVLQELQHRTATEFVDPYTVGWIYVALGDNDKALKFLQLNLLITCIPKFSAVTLLTSSPQQIRFTRSIARIISASAHSAAPFSRF